MGSRGLLFISYYFFEYRNLFAGFFKGVVHAIVRNKAIKGVVFYLCTVLYVNLGYKKQTSMADRNLMVLEFGIFVFIMRKIILEQLAIFFGAL